MGTPPRDASTHTRLANTASHARFDAADFTRATRGLVAQHPTGVIETAHGVVFDVNRYAFIERGSVNPDTVNPSLWRQAQLNGIHGLFEVAPGIWQARGYDISNVTFIAGETGWIVIDPLTVEPCARACLELANGHLGERPVVAVIYTHSHTDHFGGVLGVTSQAEVDAGKCRIIAPQHFLRETDGENVIAGYAMVPQRQLPVWAAAASGPRDPRRLRIGKGHPVLVVRADRSDRRDHRHRDRTGRRRRSDRVPADAGNRSTGGDELLLSRPRLVVHRRELHPQHAQPGTDSWGAGTRFAEVVEVHRRDDGPVRRPTPS